MPARRLSDAEKRAKGVHSSARSVSDRVYDATNSLTVVDDSKKQGDVVAINPPSGLTADAKKAWADALSEIAPLGLQKSDLKTLERWCRYYALYRKVARKVEDSREDHLIEIDDKGNRKVSPEFTIMMQIDSAMLKLEKELGFTPLARMRAPAREEPEKPNVFNAFE